MVTWSVLANNPKPIGAASPTGRCSASTSSTSRRCFTNTRCSCEIFSGDRLRLPLVCGLSASQLEVSFFQESTPDPDRSENEESPRTDASSWGATAPSGCTDTLLVAEDAAEPEVAETTLLGRCFWPYQKRRLCSWGVPRVPREERSPTLPAFEETIRPNAGLLGRGCLLAVITQSRFCQRHRCPLLLPVSGVSFCTCAEISQRARRCPWQRSRYGRLESRHNLPLRPKFLVHADYWQCLRRRRGQSFNWLAIWLPPGLFEGNTLLPCGCQRRRRR